jgi:hypothetical protein
MHATLSRDARNRRIFGDRLPDRHRWDGDPERDACADERSHHGAVVMWIRNRFPLRSIKIEVISSQDKAPHTDTVKKTFMVAALRSLSPHGGAVLALSSRGSSLGAASVRSPTILLQHVAAMGPRPEQNELPMLHAVLNRAASHLDEVVTATLLDRRLRSDLDVQIEALGHRERMKLLNRLEQVYDRPEHYSDVGSFFPRADAIAPELRRVRRISSGSVFDATWSSDFSPHLDEVADLYLGHGTNRRAAARLFIHDGPPRPVAILVHGFRCGQFAIEERVWPIDWLFKGGLDVALPVLPFHAVRSPRGPALFPSSNPGMTIEGFRQSIRDLRSLADFLLDRGAPSVGFMGMSLGGYATALLATIDDRLSFAVPIIPLASIAFVVRASRRLVGSAEEQQLQFEAIERTYRAVSPLARPARLDKDRILVIGAAGDRITPIEHARLLATHFDAPLEIFPGGHLLQFGRAQGFRAAGRLLRRLGLL